MATSKAADEAQSNYGIDFVIVHKGDAAKFERLVVALAEVGISSQVRNGEDQTLLVFTRVANKERLYGEVYRSRSVPMLQALQAATDQRTGSRTGSTVCGPPSPKKSSNMLKPVKTSIPPNDSALSTS